MSKQKDRIRKRRATQTGRRHQIGVLTEEEVFEVGMDALTQVADDGLSNEDWDWLGDEDEPGAGEEATEEIEATEEVREIDWGEHAFETLCISIIAKDSGNKDVSEAA